MNERYLTTRAAKRQSNQGRPLYIYPFIVLLISLSWNTNVYGQTGRTDSVANMPASTEGSTIKEKLDSAIPSGHTDHVYRMNYWVSIPFSLVATAADIYAIPNIIKAKKGLTDAELQGLNTEAFSEFDKWAFRQDASKRDQHYKNSDYLLPVIIASAATLGLDKNIRKDWVRILMMYYEMHAVTFSIYNFSPFGPAFQDKLRPVVYYTSDFSAADRGVGNNRNSLYSGHTATAAASTFFMVKVYSDYHPELGRKKYLLYALATIPPLVEGYLRMKALAHFPSDILVGTVIGAACGVAIPALHKTKRQNIRLGVINSPMGPGISFGWQPSYERKGISNSFSPGLH